MKEDNLTDLLKKAYRIQPAPAGLWGRIKNEALNEKAVLERSGVTFARTSENQDSASQNNVFSINRFTKKQHTKKSAIISISAAAACILICVVTLAATGTFSKKNTTADSAVLSETELSVGNVTQIESLVPETQTLMNIYDIASSDNFVSQTLEFNKDDVSKDFNAESLMPAIISSDSKHVAAKFESTFSVCFSDSIPENISVICALFDENGTKVSPASCDITADCIREETTIDIKVANSESYIPKGMDLSKGYYLMYTLAMTEGDISRYHIVGFRIDNTSDELLAKVVSTSPVLVVEPVSPADPFAEAADITLTNPTFVKYIDENKSIAPVEDSFKLQAEDVVLFKYDSLNPGNTFPSTIDSCVVITNPTDEIFSAKSYNLGEIMSTYGDISQVSYLNLSTGVDEYLTSEKKDVDSLIEILNSVKVSVATSAQIADGTWEKDGSLGTEMWQLTFAFENKSDFVILRFNSLEIVTTLRNDILSDSDTTPTNVKLVFAEGTSLSTDKLAQLATTINHTQSKVSAETILAASFDASYEIVNYGVKEKSLMFGQGYSIDLNSDGVYEEIYADIIPESSVNGEFTNADICLIINKKVFSISQIGFVITPVTSEYYIMDLDANDAYSELAFLDYGPSDDLTTTFFRYEDENLYKLGLVESFPSSSAEGGDLIVNGDGTLSASKRLSILQTWFAKADYRIGSSNLLEEVKKDIYYPNAESNAVAKFDLILYSRMDKNSENIVIPSGEVSFLATDDNEFVLVRAADGTEGWLCIENGEIQTMPGTGFVTDVFEGLNLVD